VNDSINTFEGVGELIGCNVGYCDSFELFVIFCVAQLQLVDFRSTGCTGVASLLGYRSTIWRDDALRSNAVAFLQQLYYNVGTQKSRSASDLKGMKCVSSECCMLRRCKRTKMS